MKNAHKLSLVILLALVACDQAPQMYEYSEDVFGRQLEKKVVSSETPTKSSSPFKWTTPEGWIEAPASSMRIASFKLNSNLDFDVSIIALPGDVGGLKANIARWFGQVDVSLGDQDLDNFLSKAQIIMLNDNEHQASFYNFSWRPEVSERSILAGILDAHGSKIFFKAMGEKQLLEQNKDKFLSLIQTFKIHE